jgi:hypothetical protein
MATNLVNGGPTEVLEAIEPLSLVNWVVPSLTLHPIKKPFWQDPWPSEYGHQCHCERRYNKRARRMKEFPSNHS